MPGLSGYVDFNHSSEQKGSILQNMIQSMKHEDWYRAEYYVAEGIACARIHLGIFNPAPQPIFNEAGTLSIFFHGEIYDYEDQKRQLEKKGYLFKVNNDAEFILHLFEEKGLQFADDLNGSFVCAIWDKKRKKLIVANDRYGLRPLYYTELASKLIFSSEVKPITSFPGFNKEINLRAIPDLLAFGSMLGENTLFENVYLMPSGSIMVYEQGKLTISKYWDFEYNEDYPKRDLSDYCEELHYLFHQAIKRQSKGNHKIGVPLSGGLDSRVVGAYLHKEGVLFSAHTYGVKRCYDFRFARRVARALKAAHYFYETNGEYIPDYHSVSLRLTNGMLDICDTQQIILPTEIYNDCDVLHIGFMADVIFGGSYIREYILNLSHEKELPNLVYDSFSFFIQDRIQKNILRNSINRKVKNSSLEKISWRLSQTNAKLSVNKADYVYLHERAKRFTINANLILLNQRLEYRTPTYDNDLMDFALKLPPEMRINSLLYTELIKRYFPKLARIPWQKDGFPLTASYARKRIQNSIRYRIAHAFNEKLAKYLPYEHWHNLELWTKETHRDFFLGILLDQKTLNRPYFNQEYIRENIIEPHMNGQINFWTAISILTTFELWHRYFFDD